LHRADEWWPVLKKSGGCENTELQIVVWLEVECLVRGRVTIVRGLSDSGEVLRTVG